MLYEVITRAVVRISVCRVRLFISQITDLNDEFNAMIDELLIELLDDPDRHGFGIHAVHILV